MQQLDDKYMPKGDLEIFKSKQELEKRLDEIDSSAIIYESGSEPKLVKKEENKKKRKTKKSTNKMQIYGARKNRSK
ncbi:MAG: hypothetical protein GY928_00550 [Colwellia sp.]|nr:hypothetical protein [Colwellia sp.]